MFPTDSRGLGTVRAGPRTNTTSEKAPPGIQTRVACLELDCDAVERICCRARFIPHKAPPVFRALIRYLTDDTPDAE